MRRGLLPSTYSDECLESYLSLDSDPPYENSFVPSFLSPSAIAASMSNSVSTVVSGLPTDAIWTGRESYQSPMPPDIAPPGLYDYPLNDMTEDIADSGHALITTPLPFAATAEVAAAGSVATSPAVSTVTSSVTSSVISSTSMYRNNEEPNSPQRGNKRSHTSNMTHSNSSNDNEKIPKYEFAEDDNCCPICLDEWEQCGDHRLVSLVCGHLFGLNCIRRWLLMPGVEPNCPQCKDPATISDIRVIYAKNLKVSNPAQSKLRYNFDYLKTNFDMLKTLNEGNKKKIESLINQNGRLNLLIDQKPNVEVDHVNSSLAQKLQFERKVELPRKLMTRVMISNPMRAQIIFTEHLHFPKVEYGVKFFDTTTNKVLNSYIGVSLKCPMNLCLNYNNSILASASMESFVKLFDLRSHCEITKLDLINEEITACDFGGKLNERAFYLGTDNGLTYIYDTRFKNKPVDKLYYGNNRGPIISVISVEKSPIFQYNGFIVMTQDVLWFCFMNSIGRFVSIDLRVEGPLVSIRYDKLGNRYIICARDLITNLNTRLIVGKLMTVRGAIHFYQEISIAGSMISPIGLSPTNIVIDNNMLSAGYIQNNKHLLFIDKVNNENILALPVNSNLNTICHLQNENRAILASFDHSSEFVIYSIRK